MKTYKTYQQNILAIQKAKPELYSWIILKF